jgi:hypothetical protein
MGLPVDTGIGFDTPSVVVALTVLIMLAGLALLLWAVRTRDQGDVQRAERRTEAVIEIPTTRGDRRAEVPCQPPARVEREKRHLRLVA